MEFDQQLKLELLYHGNDLYTTKKNLEITVADRMHMHNRLKIKNTLFFHLMTDISLLCYRKFDKYNFDNEN